MRRTSFTTICSTHFTVDGVDLRRRTLLERKEALRAVIPGKHPQLHFSEHFKGASMDVLAQACRMGLEGIISKRADAIHRSSRTEPWLKEKCINNRVRHRGLHLSAGHPERLSSGLTREGIDFRRQGGHRLRSRRVRAARQKA